MDIEQLKQDVREGRIGLERLVDLIGMLLGELDRATKRIEELEAKLGGSPTEKVDTLKEILDPATFNGIVVSDDAAVYANFSKSQNAGLICFAKPSN